MSDTPAVRLMPAPDPAPAGPVEARPAPEAAGRKARARAKEAPRDDDASERSALPAPTVEALLLSAAAAARLCSVSPATWYRMASAGRCPAPIHLSRGCVRWRAEELHDWIAAGAPDRKTWEARIAAANAGGRPRQAGR